MGIWGYLGLLDIGSLLTFGTLGHVERYAVIFLETLVTAADDCGKVGEQIVATVVGSNEAKAFGIIKPFHYTCCHILTFLLNREAP
jgi:hypothetical protein